MTSSANNTQQIRRSIRSQMFTARNQLNKSDLQAMDQQFGKIARQCSALKNANRIASYMPIKGEAPTQAIHQLLHHKQLYIPKIFDRWRRIMHFTRLEYTKKVNNQFGIIEGKSINNFLTAKQIDAIIVPVVAFDHHGNRLGMGGGYYDRALAFKQYRRSWNAPLLLGLAYDFQQTEQLIQQPWDVPLDVIITNRGILIPRQTVLKQTITELQ